MAEFSKQWCDLYDPGGMTPDFDIIEIFESLENKETYTPIICEGFGFLGIGRDKNDRCILCFEDSTNPEFVEWVDYEQFIKKEKEGI
jgi:hypothetical protein